MVQLPPVATAVPSTVVPSTNCTVKPASAVPVKTGVVTRVILSEVETPLSLAAVKSGKFRSHAAAAFSFVDDISGGGDEQSRAKRIGRKANKLTKADKRNSS